MKRKNLISLTIAFTVLFLASTGLLLYFGIKPRPVTSIHVLGGLLFIGFIIFHIKNNWASLKVYSKERKGTKLKKELVLSVLIVAIIATGAAFSLPPFGQIEHAGENLTRGGEERGPGRNEVSFTKISTNKDQTSGLPISLSFQNDQSKVISAMVVWVEDSSHHFVQNLFVPSKWMQLPAWAKDEDKVRHAFEDHEATVAPFSSSLMNEWSKLASDTIPNYAEANPSGNYILSSSSKLRDKFYVRAEVKYVDGSELLQTFVDTAKSPIYILQSNNQNSAAKAIVSL